MVKKVLAAKGKKAANSKVDTEEHDEKQNEEQVEVNTVSPKKEVKSAIQNNTKIDNQTTNEKTDIVKESPKKNFIQPTEPVVTSTSENVDKNEHSEEKKAEIEEGIVFNLSITLIYYIILNLYILINLEIDNRSIYVKNVDFSATCEELEEHFKAYGSVNRITIICDKFTGIPKG